MKPINSVVPAQNPSIALVDKRSHALVSSIVMAEKLGTTNKAVLQLIKTHEKEFEKFGRVAFEMRPFATKGGNQKRRIALLTEDQAFFLLALSKNTEKSVALKVNLVTAFSRFKNNQQAATNYLPLYSGLQDALKTLAEYAAPDNASVMHGVLSMQYNGLINKACGIAGGKRSSIKTESHANLANVTGLVIAEINNGMAEGLDSRDILRQVKDVIAPIAETISDLSFKAINGGAL